MRAGAGIFRVLTVTEIVEVDQLVIPLCDNAQGVFEESDDNEESADRREVSVFESTPRQAKL